MSLHPGVTRLMYVYPLVPLLAGIQSWTLPAVSVSSAFAQAVQGSQERRIVVELSTQRVKLYEGLNLVATYPCSTGKHHATPIGTFPIRDKRRFNKALPEYGSAPIPFSLRLDVVLNGKRHPIALHEYPVVPKHPASHGCIRLRRGDAASVFEWASVGTVVVIRD